MGLEATVKDCPHGTLVVRLGAARNFHRLPAIIYNFSGTIR